jgi:hypothetical protein
MSDVFFAARLRDFGRELLVLRLAAVAAGLFFFLPGMSEDHSIVCSSSVLWVMCDRNSSANFLPLIAAIFQQFSEKSVEKHWGRRKSAAMLCSLAFCTCKGAGLFQGTKKTELHGISQCSDVICCRVAPIALKEFKKSPLNL